ncbi:MAG: ubiquitin-like domain-containing protein [Bacillota bacterium]|nr:ubiquitin-like domain-containing protein [Bacillota bacterium]
MKLYVDVRTPGNGKVYEFQLESAMTVGQAKQKMIEEILEIEQGNVVLKDSAVLSNITSKSRLNDGDTLRAAGVRSGNTLILL